jgi:hypothetical protein
MQDVVASLPETEIGSKGGAVQPVVVKNGSDHMDAEA